jgi:hypothetical protein
VSDVGASADLTIGAVGRAARASLQAPRAFVAGLKALSGAMDREPSFCFHLLRLCQTALAFAQRLLDMLAVADVGWPILL